MKVVYAYCKPGEEGEHWARELGGASDNKCTFLPYNQAEYMSYLHYADAGKLDALYHARHPGLMRMYADFSSLIHDQQIDAVVVGDAPAFHPDYLRTLPIYKVLYSHDDPESSYIRNIPYLHAYHHVFYCTPAYSIDLDMDQKMRECGVRNCDFVPCATFDFDFDTGMSEQTLFEKQRDIDIIFIGGMYWRKVEILVHLKKVFGRRFHWYGRVPLKGNIYLNCKYKLLTWVSPVSFEERLRLHQRAKIGVNIHNGYTVPNVGNQRLYYLPANGVMQITDGIQHLDKVFDVGKEVIAYRDTTDLVEKIKYYLDHPEERIAVARNGYRRVLRDYRFGAVTRHIGTLIENGMAKIGWKK